MWVGPACRSRSASRFFSSALPDSTSWLPYRIQLTFPTQRHTFASWLFLDARCRATVLPGRENENCDVRQQQQPYEFGKENRGTTVETRDGSDILNPELILKPQKNPADLRSESKKPKLKIVYHFRSSSERAFRPGKNADWTEIFKIPS